MVVVEYIGSQHLNSRYGGGNELHSGSDGLRKDLGEAGAVTQEQVSFFEDQIEHLDWYRRIVNVALQLQSDEIYTREDAVTDLTGLAQGMAMTLGVRWKG